MQFSGPYEDPGNGMEQFPSDVVRKYGRYGRFQVVAFFRVPCFRFCKSILSGMKKLQEIDNIAILQSPSEKNRRFAS